MHHDNSKMIWWMMVICLIVPVVITLFLRNGFSLFPIAFLVACVGSHVLMMFMGHKHMGKNNDSEIDKPV